MIVVNELKVQICRLIYLDEEDADKYVSSQFVRGEATCIRSFQNNGQF